MLSLPRRRENSALDARQRASQRAVVLAGCELALREKRRRDPPDRVGELLRIAPRAFVSFPNFAHWRVRLALLWGGRMPVTRLLPVAWYETPNIHHVTVSDFRDLIGAKGIDIEAAWYLSGDRPTSDAAASWRAEHAIFLIGRA